MKLKHNKKRNTAFLFEALVREMTRAAIRKDTDCLARCKEIIKKHFSSGTVLYEELQLYRSLYETRGLSKHSAEKLLTEVRKSYTEIVETSSDAIFAAQSRVIKEINKNVSKNVFSNFVPQYKNIATIYQIFNGGLTPEKRILLEEIVCDSLSATSSAKADHPVVVDSLVMKNFVKKFNERYGDTLYEEQQRLLNKYVLSFSDNGLALKAYLHEEIGRLRTVITRGLKQEDIAEDKDMSDKTKQVLGVLDGLSLIHI